MSVAAGRPTAQEVPENPLTAGLERLPVAPTGLVIFGATGDLARRKLLPALYNLAHDGALPERFHLIGVSRSDMPHGDYRELAIEAIRNYSRRPPDEQVLQGLLEEVRYIPGSFDDESVYGKLADTLGRSRGDLFATVDNLNKFTATLARSDAQQRQGDADRPEQRPVGADPVGDLVPNRLARHPVRGASAVRAGPE